MGDKMTITGHVKDNKIVINDNIELPNGTIVHITVPEDNRTESTGLCGIWKDDRPAEAIVDEIITSRSEGRDIHL